MNEQGSTPPSEGKFPLETPDHPIVRDSPDNPVVRQRGLEQALLPVRRWLWTATGIGVVNVVGPRVAEHAPSSLPIKPSAVIHLILQLF